jgi:alpha-L-rhamnosidase
MLETSFPSFGYMLGLNATTIWESWFFSDNTYSHNHPMFDSVVEWARKRLLGIDQTASSAAFSELLLLPRPPLTQLTSASGSLSTVRGTISSSWEYRAGQWLWNVTVPANTRAQLCLPVLDTPCTPIGPGNFSFAVPADQVSTASSVLSVSGLL